MRVRRCARALRISKDPWKDELSRVGEAEVTELNRPQLSVSGPSLAPHQTGQAVLPHPAFRGSFVASLHSGFAIERTLQLPNL